MADKRPKDLTTEETTFRGFVHSDDATNGSRKFDLARIGQALTPRLPATGYHHPTTGAAYATFPVAAFNYGLNDFTLRLRELITAAPGSTGAIWRSHSTGNNRVELRLTTGRVLVLRIVDSGGSNADYTMGTYALTLSQVEDATLAVDRDGNAVLYAYGIAAATTAVSASSAVDIGSGNSNAGALYSSAPGVTLSFEHYNLALSSLEVAILVRQGPAGLPQYVHAGGGGQVLYTSDFSFASLNGWVVGSGVTGTSNVDTDADGAGYPPSDDWFKIEATGSTAYTLFRTDLIGGFIGKRLRFAGSFLRGPTGPQYLNVFGNSGARHTNDTGPLTLSVGTVLASNIEFTPVDNLLRLSAAISNGNQSTTGAGATSYYKSLTLTTVGLCGRWVFDRNTGMTVPDLSGGSRPLLLTAGTGWLQAPSLDIPLNQAVTHGGAGPLQFGGQGVIDTTHAWAIDSLVVESTAAVTWSLGTASGGAQIISGKSLSIGRNYIADADFVTRFLTGANLWSNSNGAATITIRAKLRKV